MQSVFQIDEGVGHDRGVPVKHKTMDKPFGIDREILDVLSLLA